MAPFLAIALIGWNKQKHWSMNTKEEYTEKNCYSTVAPVYSRPSMHYLKELQINRLKMKYCTTIPTRSLMKLYKHTTQDTHHTSSLNATKAVESLLLPTAPEQLLSPTNNHNSFNSLTAPKVF